MKLRLVFFIIGSILLLISFPLGSKMIMELIHNIKMNAQYDIINVSQGEPPTEATYNFKNHLVQIRETIKETNSHKDPWDNNIALADLALEVDGKQLDVLNNHPIRVDEEGLNRYYGEIGYLILKDKRSNDNHFIILLKKTRELQKKKPNGDIIGWVPDEKLEYALYAVDEKGKVEKEYFSFTEPDALQTELLNAAVLGPHQIGYYTNAWEGIPTIIFPLIFPLLTLIIGIVLVIICFPKRKKSSILNT